MAELRDRLGRAGFSPSIVEETVEWCHRIGYVDDARFAAEWIEYRILHNPSGRRRLQQELRQKGVDRALVEQALDEWLPREEERRLCLQAAQRRHPRVARLEPEVRQRRLTSFLQRRGFSYEDIRSALHEVDTLSHTE